MHGEESREKKNRNAGLMASIGFHLALAVVFIFLVGWSAPNPPLAEYGIELNFGLDDQGSGDVQPDNPVGNEVVDDAEPKQEEVKEEIKAEEKIEEKVDENVKKDEVVAREDNPVSLKEVKKEEKKEVKKEDPKVTKEPNTTDKQESTIKTDKKGEELSQGDDKKKEGDKGKPDGKLDEKALYGNKGGGNNGTGTGLDLAGWSWDKKPDPKLPENEAGRMVFEIEVDENGEIIRLTPVERGLSLQAEKICRDEIMKLTFSPTGTNLPARSKGKITFVVKAQ